MAVKNIALRISIMSDINSIKTLLPKEENVEYKVAQLEAPPQSTELTEQQKKQAKFSNFEDFMLDYNRANFSKSIARYQQSWCTQGWIKSYAELISYWLRSLVNSKAYDPNFPIYLLEAEATTGQFGLSVLKELKNILHETTFADCNICYLFALSNRSDNEKLSEHPLYQYYEENRQAAIVQWDTLSVEPLPEVDNKGQIILYDANPVVFIANGVFSSLPQQCCYIHYSDLYLAQTTLIEESTSELVNAKTQNFIPWTLRNKKNDANKNTESLAYQWQATNIENITKDLKGNLQHAISKVLKHLLTQCRSQPLWVPITALRLLYKLQQQCSKGILYLQSDKGMSALFPGCTHIKLPTKVKPENIRLPINFELLIQCCNELYSKKTHSTTLLQDRPAGKALHIAMLGENTYEQYAIIKAAADKVFNKSTPERHNFIIDSLSRMAEVLTETQMMSHLRQQDYDSKLLSIFLPRLLKQGVDVNQRTSWCRLMSEVWNRHIPVIGNTEIVFKLGLLAIDLSHWALAKQCFVMIIQLQGPNTPCLHNLALAAFATGDITLAKECISTAIEYTLQNEQIQQLLADINAYEQRCESLIWYTPIENQTNTSKPLLRLVPLGKQHLGEYYLQYRDPNIAQRLRGLQLNSYEHLQQLWSQWQEEGDNNEKAYYAMLHEDLGFIGSVLLEIEGRVEKFECRKSVKSNKREAILSFWIGTDYQGYGFGSEIVSQAVKQAQLLINQQLIDGLIASAWQYNSVSRSLLLQNGFYEAETNNTLSSSIEIHYRKKLI